MKRGAKMKILSFLLCFVLCFALSACGGEGNGDASSQAPVSGVLSDASDESDTVSDESVPNSDGDISQDISQDASEDNSDSSSDSSRPNVEAPPATHDEIFDYAQVAGSIQKNATSRHAVSYNIDYTKVDPTSAVQCVTNDGCGITAVYDGAVTRFFDSVTGEYYDIMVGKYLYPCCDIGFIQGELGVSDDYSYAITFSRKEDFNPIAIERDSDHNHGGDYPRPVTIHYSAERNMAYLVYPNGDGEGMELYYFTEDSYVACRDTVTGKYGVVCNGEVIIPFEYSSIDSLQGASNRVGGSDGDVGVFRAVKDGKTYYISTNGRNLTPNGFTCGSAPYKDRAWVFDGSQGYVIQFG